jgi:O-antigen/teichoic acid export membrane protein
VLANLIQSAFTLLLLSSEIRQIKLKFDFRLWKEMVKYGAPLIVAGLGGMINETFDRLMLGWWLPGDKNYQEQQVGIYNACYKLSILITLSVQAFRMGAEPFFFKQAEGANPQRVYARVMKFFVIVVSVMFLLVSLYIPIWKVMIISPRYYPGLGIVPILLMANICLGIYYNLTIWYKLANRTTAGATITLIGAAITLLINYFFIPNFGFFASAWATFICYFSMMVISFVWGQKVYYVPYAWKKLTAYLIIVLVLFFIHQGLTALWGNTPFSLITATMLTFAYLYFVLQIERKEVEKMPLLRRFVRPAASQAPSAP